MSAVGANIGLRACFTCNFFLFVKSFILYVTIGIIMVDHHEMSLSKQYAGWWLHSLLRHVDHIGSTDNRWFVSHGSYVYTYIGMAKLHF